MAMVPSEPAKASASHDKKIKWRIYHRIADLLLGVSPVNLEDHYNLHDATVTI